MLQPAPSVSEGAIVCELGRTPADREVNCRPTLVAMERASSSVPLAARRHDHLGSREMNLR
jgi:hypothetical protein